MGIFQDPNDPLHVFLQPPPGETPQERVLREQQEAEEKRISDTIDEGIRREKSALKKQTPIRVLLLGQAESGKSTTLKNFRVKYSNADWVRERAGWRSVIQLNLIRSILTVIDTLRLHMDSEDDAMIYPFPWDEGDSATSSEDDDTGGDTSATRPTTHVSEKVKMLLLGLGPLRTVEKELKQRLGAGSDEVRAEDVVDLSEMSVTPFDRHAPVAAVRRPRKEFCVRRWNDVLEAAAKFASGQRLHTKHNATGRLQQSVIDEPTEIIATCKDDMKLLWTDDCVKNVLQRRDIQLEHSAGFFLDDLDRIATREYEPTDEDILRARLRTVGVQEHKLLIESTKCGSADWIFYDVGGARTMRATWMPYFDDINAIIFLAPVSTFDERLLEDRKVNRLEDSFILWKSICSSKLLAKATLVLFLNKCDILKQKIKRGVPVGKYLPSYANRPNEPTAVLKYLRDKFIMIQKDVSPNPYRGNYCHATTVIDMKATGKTLVAVQDGILRENLRHAELV